ncbi:MAG: hypothetical protein ACJ79R_14875 [Anaeromyxobacteraceae bacterium]|jgi:hypothetical protein
MNDTFRELKDRIRKLDALLEQRGVSSNLLFAQALSQLHRLEKRGDRSREPTPEVRALLEKVEGIGRAM